MVVGLFAIGTRGRAALLASCGATLILTACSSSAPQTPASPTPSAPAVTALRIDGVPPSLSIGQSVQLSASVTLTDGAEKVAAGVTWHSSDTAVATVSADGMLTIVGSGGADIAASASQHDAAVHVSIERVLPPAPEPPPVPAQSFTGLLCPNNRPDWLPASTPQCSTHDPTRAVYSFQLSPGQTAFVNAQFRAKADYYSESLYFGVRCGTTVLWDRQMVGGDGWQQSGPIPITVSAPCLVEVEAGNYQSAFKSATNTPTDYRIDVSPHR